MKLTTRQITATAVTTTKRMVPSNPTRITGKNQQKRNCMVQDSKKIQSRNPGISSKSIDLFTPILTTTPIIVTNLFGTKNSTTTSFIANNQGAQMRSATATTWTTLRRTEGKNARKRLLSDDSPVDIDQKQPQQRRMNYRHISDQERQYGSIRNGCSTTTTSPVIGSVPVRPRMPWRIYCDMDGVLTDFDSGVEALTGKRPNQFKAPKQLWSSIRRQCSQNKTTNTFYETLPWMPDGPELWNALRPLQPTILTGCPHDPTTAPYQKFQWCQRELGHETLLQHLNYAAPKRGHQLVLPSPPGNNKTNEFTGTDTTNAAFSEKDEDEQDENVHENICSVITCWSKNKHCESGPGRVMIDDRKSFQNAWEAMGGIFIWHESTTTTLQQMQNLGILPPPKSFVGAEPESVQTTLKS